MNHWKQLKDHRYLSDILKGIVLTSIAAICIAWGTQLDARNTAQQIAQTRAAEEVVQIDMTGAKMLGVLEVSAGKFSSQRIGWTALQTKDWMLLNGGRPVALCPDILSSYAKRLAPLTSGLEADAIEFYLSAVSNKTVPVAIYVPHFTGLPEGLSSCLGATYDPQSLTLKVGGRTVAFMAANQPALTQ